MHRIDSVSRFHTHAGIEQVGQISQNKRTLLQVLLQPLVCLCRISALVKIDGKRYAVKQCCLSFSPGRISQVEEGDTSDRDDSRKNGGVNIFPRKRPLGSKRSKARS